jgi:hypothetical protein
MVTTTPDPGAKLHASTEDAVNAAALRRDKNRYDLPLVDPVLEAELDVAVAEFHRVGQVALAKSLRWAAMAHWAASWVRRWYRLWLRMVWGRSSPRSSRRSSP